MAMTQEFFMSSVRLNVQGLSCGACERHVKTALKPLPGVQNVIVDLETGQVLVSGAIDSLRLVEALKTAGYPSKVIDQMPDTNANKQPAGGGCCCCR